MGSTLSRPLNKGDWHSLPEDLHLLVTDHLLVEWKKEEPSSQECMSQKVEDCLRILLTFGIPSWKRRIVGEKLHVSWNVWIPVTIGMESLGHGYVVLRSAVVRSEKAFLCSDMGHKLVVHKGDTIKVGRDDRIQIVSRSGKSSRFLPNCQIRLPKDAFHILEVDMTWG